MPAKKPTQSPQSRLFYNVLIVILSIVVIGFLYSFTKKNLANGVVIQNKQLNDSQKELLALDIYESNPVLDVKIEVLNGTGEKGIAAKTADYLRSKQLDVLRWENADNFNYKNTILIQRSDNLLNLNAVASALNIGINDQERVLIQPSTTSDVDITLILGKDYRTIKPIRVYFANLIQDIKVEVLNGMGKKGIAAKVAEYLSSDQIEVLRSENADNFDYERTVLINRSENNTNLQTLADALSFDVNDKERVINRFNGSTDVDFTVILGKDYNAIKPISTYLAN